MVGTRGGGGAAGAGRDAVPARPPFWPAGPVALAHRGWSPDPSRGLENSMAAFAAAVDLGYRYLETDAHATADGTAVAFHDATLDRATDGRGAVAAQRWAEVSRARIGGTEPVPALEELLGAWPHVRVNLDVKADTAVAPVVAALLRTRAAHRVCVASFSSRRRRAVLAGLARAGVTGVATSASREQVVRFLGAARAGVRGTALRRASGLPAAEPVLQVPERAGRLGVVTPATLAAARSAGTAVHVWVVDEAADMRRLLDDGARGLVTDRADRLREVLLARGQWPTEPPEPPDRAGA